MGSSGGGGNSGKVDYPGYMKDWHGDFLGGNYTGPNIDTLLQDAIGNSPFATAVAFDPTDYVEKIVNKADDTAVQITRMDQIDEQVDFESMIYPRFEGGMRDINAVQTSAFVQGRANIAADYASRLASKKMDLCVQHSTAYYDAQKMAILAFQGERDQNIELDVKDAKWDLEMTSYGVRGLGAIQGVSPVGSGGGSEVSDGQQALAGAATGAMVGSQIYPGVGTAVGAVVGGVAGYLM